MFANNSVIMDINMMDECHQSIEFAFVDLTFYFTLV